MTKREKQSAENYMKMALKGMEDALKPDIQNMPTNDTEKFRIFCLNRGYYDGIKDLIATTDRNFYNELMEKYTTRYVEILEKSNKLHQKIFQKVDKY